VDILSPPIPGETMAIMVMPLIFMDQLVPPSQLLLLVRMPLESTRTTTRFESIGSLIEWDIGRR